MKIELKQKFENVSGLADAERLVVLNSGILLGYSWDADMSYDPSTQKLTAKKEHAPGFIYIQPNGEVFFRCTKGSGWVEPNGKIKIVTDEIMLGMGGNASTAYVWGTWGGKANGLHAADRKTLQVTRTLYKAKSEEDYALYILACPDEEHLIVLHTGYEFSKFEIGSGKKTLSFEGASGSEESPMVVGKQYLVSHSGEGSSVWDIHSGKIVSNLPDEYWPKAFAFSDDESLCMCIDDDGVKAWDIAKQEFVFEHNVDGGVNAGGFTPGKSECWILDADNNLGRWEYAQ